MSKEKCKFWEKCYNTTKEHRERFIHPSATSTSSTKGSSFKPAPSSSSSRVQITASTSSSGTGDFIYQKEPCPEWKTCKRTGDNAHKAKYYHPCRNYNDVNSCELKKNEIHLNNFLHACPDGAKCTLLQSKEHCIYFVHASKAKPCCVLQVPQTLEFLPFCSKMDSCNESTKSGHYQQYRHICSKAGKCSKMSEETHKREYLHPCKYGENCRKATDSKHSMNFVHPCRYGLQCRLLARAEMPHCIIYSHKAVSSSLIQFSWPSSWQNPSPPNPKTLDMSKTQPYFKLVPLAASNQEYQTVYNYFVQQLQGIAHTLVSIERVENCDRWKWYCLKKYELEQKNKNANEKLLFHGTAGDIAKLITSEGFDFRVAAFTGMFGAGIYFSPYSNYSHGFAPADATGVRRMFVSRVLVGNPHVCGSGAFRRPPQIPNSTEYYDSVVGTNGHHIVYDNDQAYPEYMITYK